MESFKAINKVNGLERTFSKLQWDLMGKKNTNWIIVQETPVIPEPSTGEKKEEVVEDVEETQTEVVFEDVKKKEEFYKACVNINKGALKDYLDKNEITYSQNSTVKELVEVLGANFSYDKQIVKDNF